MVGEFRCLGKRSIMTIRFRCPKCKEVLKAPVESAGKRARCRQCQTLILIPTPKTPTSGPSPDAGPERLEEPAKTPPHRSGSPPRAKRSEAKRPEADPSKDARSQAVAPVTRAAASLVSAPTSTMHQASATHEGCGRNIPTKATPMQPIEMTQDQPNPSENASMPFSDSFATESVSSHKSSSLDDPFGGLPEFQAMETPVANPGQVDDLLSEAMSVDHQLHRQATPAVEWSDHPIPPVSQPVANNLIDTGENLSGVLNAMEGTLQAAMLQQQQRKASEIAAKVTVAEVQGAFQGRMAEFDHTIEVKGRTLTTATAMIVFPLCFSIFVVFATLGMAVLPVFWLAGKVPNLMGGSGLLLYPLFWMFLLAAWVPVFHLVLATISILFPRSGKNVEGEPVTKRTLSREGQPVFHEFVTQICERVGAPPPARIDLDTDFNASASFRRGWQSFGKDDLVLTLGVPLIACQSTGQLASIIAHEFGHFRQGSAMRSTFLIRTLTGWFMQSAYHGNMRAQMMEHYQDSEDANNEFLIFWSIVGFLGRQMMWFFGLAGHALSGSLSREMEYDADRHAIHLAGTKNFVNAMANVEKFGVAHAMAIENLRELYCSSGILVDNISRFTLHIGKTMPAAVVMRMIEEKREEKLKLCDTHPPTRDRAAAAQQMNQPGVLQMDRPASDLIRHWQLLCENNTINFYANVLEDPPTKDQVTKLEDVLRDEHKLLLDKR